jgi:SpoVK/Ycf46/Vps4 family AAA+-type ATPase
MLDPALIRPGRFGCHIKIKTPTDAERKEIFNIYLMQKIKYSEKNANVTNLFSEIDLDKLVKLTPDYNGSMIMNLFNEVLKSKEKETLAKVSERKVEEIKNNLVPITTNDFENIIKKSKNEQENFYS